MQILQEWEHCKLCTYYEHDECSVGRELLTLIKILITIFINYEYTRYTRTLDTLDTLEHFVVSLRGKEEINILDWYTLFIEPEKASFFNWEN